jgi:class 3 adenylate cyclase
MPSWHGLTTAGLVLDNLAMPEDSANAKPAETRRLAAIMFTDIVGFSRQMSADEARTLRRLAVHNHVSSKPSLPTKAILPKRPAMGS